MLISFFGLFGLLTVYAVIIARWRRGFDGLLLYLPVSGMVTLALYPWAGGSVIKDVVFIVPSYLGFLLHRFQHPSRDRYPSEVVASMLFLAILVTLHLHGRKVENALMAIIGFKTWLFYMPLYFLTFSLVASSERLIRLMRILVAVALIPSIFGIGEIVAAQAVGYNAVIEAVYGELGAAVTQSYHRFLIGEGQIARFPSTFTFVSQYFAFTLSMIVPCYALSRLDPSKRWRRFAALALGVVALAALLAGQRLAFIYVPAFLLLIFFLDFGWRGVPKGVAAATVSILLALSVLGISIYSLYDYLFSQIGDYVNQTAVTTLVRAISEAPLGMGTGTSTGAARYAVDEPEAFAAFENYYAKATYELGISGLVAVCALYAAIVVPAYRKHRHLKHAPFRSCSAAILGFMILMIFNNLKGWMVDLDPVNVYLWVFAGALARLAFLDRRVSASGLLKR